MKDGVRYGGDYIEYVYDLTAVDAVDKLKLRGVSPILAKLFKESGKRALIWNSITQVKADM